MINASSTSQTVTNIETVCSILPTNLRPLKCKIYQACTRQPFCSVETVDISQLRRLYLLAFYARHTQTDPCWRSMPAIHRPILVGVLRPPYTDRSLLAFYARHTQTDPCWRSTPAIHRPILQLPTRWQQLFS